MATDEYGKNDQNDIEQPIFLGDEPAAPVTKKNWFTNSNSSKIGSSIFAKQKTHVSPYDIFKLAQRILLVCAIIYVTFALIRIYYPGNCGNTEGAKEVWEYSKVILNSIVSLVLGLYFGSKQKSDKSN